MTLQFEASGKLKQMSDDDIAAIEEEDSYVLVLDHGTCADGRPCWVFIKVKPSKYREFLRVSKLGTIKRPSDYGTVIKYGFDKEVPTAIKEEMKQKYGFDEDFLQKREAIISAEKKVFLQGQENKRLGNIVAMLKKKQG